MDSNAFLKDWSDFTSRFLDAQEVLRKMMQPIVDVEKVFLESINPVIEKLQNPQLQENFRGFLEELHRAYDELPIYMREVVLLFGEHGWYLDIQMTFPEIKELKRMFSEGRVNDAEEFLSRHFKDRLDGIEVFVSSKFSHRAHLI